MKCERFFAHVYFSNETVSQTTVSTGPMKMFRLEHETMNVCQRNVTRFAYVDCMFYKLMTFFLGFGSLVSLRLQKDRRAKSQQIWTNLSHWNTDGLSSRFEDLLLFFKSLCDRSACETAVIYYYITTTEFFIMRNVTQRVEMSCMGKNFNRHLSRNFDTFDIF